MATYSKAKYQDRNNVLRTLFKKGRDGKWTYDVNQPLFKESTTRENKDHNRHNQLGRSRAIMEETLPGGSSVFTKRPLCFLCVLESLTPLVCLMCLRKLDWASGACS